MCSNADYLRSLGYSYLYHASRMKNYNKMKEEFPIS